MTNTEWYRRLNEKPPVPVGTRIRLTHMGDDPDPIEVGAIGTVTGGNAAQLWVKWDNGRSLILLPDHDRFEVVK